MRLRAVEVMAVLSGVRRLDGEALEQFRLNFGPESGDPASGMGIRIRKKVQRLQE
jgi:hypothetical protein